VIVLKNYNKDFYQFFAISLLVIYFCVGCLGSSTVPEDHYYLLPKEKTNINRLDRPAIDSVAVSQVIAEGLYRERSILFIKAASPLELRQYHYRHWAKAPSYLLQDDIVELFRQANYAKDVVRHDPKSPATIIVKGRLLRFEQIIESTESSVNVAIEFEVINNGSEQNEKWRKIYEIREKAEGESLHAIVEAFGRALSKIYSIFLSDLKKS